MIIMLLKQNHHNDILIKYMVYKHDSIMFDHHWNF